VEVEPGAELPVHRHANEQFGIVIEGSLRFRVGDEERLVEAGGTWTIPANVPHSAVGGPAGAIVVDVFAPPRSDWQSAERLPLQPPQWPRR
jgi:quercetin dioxygenase-like cupin family protein